jgi:RNA polymerase sigma-70 factor (ECF subfamily)
VNIRHLILRVAQEKTLDLASRWSGVCYYSVSPKKEAQFRKMSSPNQPKSPTPRPATFDANINCGYCKTEISTFTTRLFRIAMSENPTDDRELIAAFKAGSETAARQLFDRYCEKLMRLARRRIGQRMNTRVDPEDVIQSAFRTFFVHVRNDEFTFEAEDDLFKLLVRLTVNKALRQIAHHRAAKRDPGKEVNQGSTDNDILANLAGHEPSPEVEVAVLDELERFLAQLPEFDRKVLELKLQGHSTTEIAESLGSYDRKIRRVLERIEAEAQGAADTSKE